MDLITFQEEKCFTPYTGCLPGDWMHWSFANLDFTDREKLKTFVLRFFEAFDINGCDSLFLHPSDYSFKVFIAIYKEIASYIPADTYKFIDWLDYYARIRSMGYRGDRQVIEDLFGVNFIFIFGLVLPTADAVNMFSQICDYAYNRGIKMVICSRVGTNEEIIKSLNSHSAKILLTKIIWVKIAI